MKLEREREMAEGSQGIPWVPLTPTWSVATVLTILVAVSMFVERSIHRLSSWLKRTCRNPLFEALEKMKDELMLLGLISLLLAATSRDLSRICIESRFYHSKFSPCTRSEVEHAAYLGISPAQDLKHSKHFGFHISLRRMLNDLNHEPCEQGHEPFVSYEGLEQLHRFIFVMAITHVSYSCLTMLLAILKIHTWRKWEEEAHEDQHYSLPEMKRATMRRQSTYVKFHASNPWSRNKYIVWVTCFFRQFGQSVGRADYLTLRTGFIINHNLTLGYDFHSYMIRSMEEEFKTIVGVSAPLWGFVVAFMLLDIKGSNLYFWVAIMPVTLVLLVGAKLQHVIATLTLESAAISGFFTWTKLKPRDDLFWFKKPELLLSLIHFVLFQNAFELASFFWFWWEFGYDSCFIMNHWLVHVRLILGFIGQFLCSYSTLPVYALVTQMGSNYKAALIPPRIRETIRGWGAQARKRRKHRLASGESITGETSTTCSTNEEEQVLEDASNNPYNTN